MEEKAKKTKVKIQKLRIILEVLKIILTFASPEPAKPLNDAQMCGSFYFDKNPRQAYHKNCWRVICFSAINEKCVFTQKLSIESVDLI